MKNIYAFALLILFTVLSGVATAAPVIKVRAGIHDRYNRMVFDWAQPVKYTMQQKDGLVSIQFNTQASANFRDVTSVSPPFIRDLNQSSTPQGLAVSFRIPDNARVQAFWSGNKVAFDVLLMTKEAPKFGGGNTENQTTAAPKAENSSGPQENVKPVDQVVADTAAQTSPATPVTTEPAAGAEPQVNAVSASGPPEPAKVPNGFSKLQTLADALENKPSETFLRQPNRTQESETTNTMTVSTDGTVIRLKPNKLSRLAAFQRAGKLWLVVDQEQKDLTPKVEGALASSLTNVKRITLTKATAFVFDFDKDDTVFSIRREGPQWNVWLNPKEKALLPPEIPLNITQDKGKEPRVVLYAGEQPAVISIKDTTLGDRLWVVPMRAPEGRIIQPRKTAIYSMLPTLIGAAIVPTDDQLRVGTLNDLVVLSAGEGQKVLLSNEKDRKYGKGEAKLTKAFRLDVALKESKNKNFTAQRQEIEKKLTESADDVAKSNNLLDMARLYLQNGFGNEAGGLLLIAKKQLPAIESKIEFRALRGMAAAMSGNRDQVEKDLTGDDIHSLPEAKLWVGYARSRDNDWQSARAAFADSGDAEKSFPTILQNRLILAKAETALEADDIISSQAELKKISDMTGMLPVEKAAHDYIRAMTYSAINKKEEALDIYRDVANGSDQLYRAKAELSLVNQLVDSKELKLEDAIERLERLRFTWRGDRLEIDILRQLGQYYIDNKQYFEGLTLWRQAASLSKNADDTDLITQRMQDVFHELYVKGGADKLPPLQALSLFDRFRELTPTGADGNVALCTLADRLASVDLLDQADPLMEEQVLKQSSGEEAAVLGSKLAGWRLLNRNAVGALKILDQSETTETISDTLSERRLLLRARALADTGKTDDALLLLKDNQSNEGLSLKADINWRQSRWSESILALQMLASNYRNQGQNKLDGPIPGLVMKMAIALSLDDNKKGLELLTAEYGEFMAKTKRAQAFDLITKQSRGGSLADLETLKGQVDEVELFQQFLKNFGT